MRTKFRQLKLVTAMSAALIGAGLGSTANAAVSLTVDGLGDAGVIQYFNTDVGVDDMGNTYPWQTMFRLFNNSEDAVAVKIRFREADDSREILDFVVWLSPYDAWSAWTSIDAAGDGSDVPGIRTDDTSCTTPAPRQGLQTESFGWLNNEVDGTRYAQFKASSIFGVLEDSQEVRAGLQRLREGYVEIIGMASFPQGTAIYAAVKHQKVVGGNTQPTCAGLEAFAFGGNADVANSGAEDVGNVLAMNAYLGRKSTGQGIGFEPVVFANFSEEVADAEEMLTEQLTDPQKPDLDSGGLASYVTDVDAQAIITDTWDGSAIPNGSAAPGVPLARNAGNGLAVTGSVDAVSATLMRTAVVNEWMRRPPQGGVFANTFSQWVLTFPTMHYYLDDTGDLGVFVSPFAFPTLETVNTQIPPFAPFNEDAGEPDQPFMVDLYNAEEQKLTYTSPVPGNDGGLTGEVNVVNWGQNTDPGNGADLGLTANNPVDFADNLFPENPRFSDDLAEARARLGWARMRLADLSTGNFFIPTNADLGLTSNASSYVYYGLPVTGFGFTVYQMDAGSVDGNMTMSFAHKYERNYELK